MKILFLSRWFPYPANNGSKLRILNLLRGLAACHELTLLSFVDPSEHGPDTSLLHGVCSEIHTVPWQEFDPKSKQARLGFLSSKPRSIVDTYSPQMDAEIHRLVSKHKYDLVIASQLPMASYCGDFKNIPVLFEEIELGSFHAQAYSSQQWLKRIRNWLTWFKLKNYLSQLLQSLTVCTVVSDQERIIFTNTFPRHKAKVVVLPNCIDLKEYQVSNMERKHHQLIFSGSFRYRANYDAMLWFLQKVYPLILEHVPDTQLLITGDHVDLPLPMAQNVHRTGYVEDIKSLIASCDASIVPIRSGGGTRLKILEAMALGTPVVATTKGAEGLDAVPGEHLLIADLPEDFAAHVIQLLNNSDLHDQISKNGREFVEKKYNWERILPHFLHLVDTAAGSARS